jgi:hypothetical protein
VCKATLRGTVSITSLCLGSRRLNFGPYAVRACGEQEDHVRVCGCTQDRDDLGCMSEKSSAVQMKAEHRVPAGCRSHNLGIDS